MRGRVQQWLIFRHTYMSATRRPSPATKCLAMAGAVADVAITFGEHGNATTITNDEQRGFTMLFELRQSARACCPAGERLRRGEIGCAVTDMPESFSWRPKLSSRPLRNPAKPSSLVRVPPR